MWRKLIFSEQGILSSKTGISIVTNRGYVAVRTEVALYPIRGAIRVPFGEEVGPRQVGSLGDQRGPGVAAGRCSDYRLPKVQCGRPTTGGWFAPADVTGVSDL